MPERLDYYVAFDQLIRLKATGSPADLAQRLEISESLVKKIIYSMKAKHNAPIVFNRQKNTYMYTVEGKFKVGFETCQKDLIFKAVRDVLDRKIK